MVDAGAGEDEGDRNSFSGKQPDQAEAGANPRSQGPSPLPSRRNVSARAKARTRAAAQAGAVEDGLSRPGVCPGWVSAGCRPGNERRPSGPAPQAPRIRGDRVKQACSVRTASAGPLSLTSTCKQARNLFYTETNTPVSPPCTGQPRRPRPAALLLRLPSPDGTGLRRAGALRPDRRSTSSSGSTAGDTAGKDSHPNPRGTPSPQKARRMERGRAGGGNANT